MVKMTASRLRPTRCSEKGGRSARLVFVTADLKSVKPSRAPR
jgi:hypothetical protein